MKIEHHQGIFGKVMTCSSEEYSKLPRFCRECNKALELPWHYCEEFNRSFCSDCVVGSLDVKSVKSGRRRCGSNKEVHEHHRVISVEVESK